MTRFEEVGVQLQRQSRSIEDCEKKFEYSCDRCSHSGLRIECDRCAISYTHQVMLTVISVSAYKKRENGKPRIRVWRCV